MTSAARIDHVTAKAIPSAPRVKPVSAKAQSVPAFAKEIGVGKSAIWEEIRAGRLRAVRLGGRTLLLAEDRERYLRSLPAVTP
jgi:hypothetical protein